MKPNLRRRGPLTTLPGAALMPGLIAAGLAIAFGVGPHARDGAGEGAKGSAGFLAASPATSAVASIASTGSPLAAAASALAADPKGAPDRATTARAVCDRFAVTLRAELSKALAAGGPAGAIDICRERAPAIAAALAKETGWRVGRTSLRVRNTADLPDVWETRALQEFDARRAKGEDPATMEFSEALGDSAGTGIFRYAKAIPMVEACAPCHGKSIAPEVAARIARLYPRDQATGFAPGDVRGAFTITEPLKP